MIIHDLRQFSLNYLATPYSRYPKGIDRANRDACRLASEFIKRDVNIYSPIAHSHAIAHWGGIDKLDGDFWLKHDQAFMGLAESLVIAELDAWQDSIGIQYERDVFQSAGKPIFYIDPKTLEVRQ